MTKAIVRIGKSWFSGEYFLMDETLHNKILNIIKDKCDVRMGDAFELDFEIKSIRRLDED